jgi:hypothetical protein
VSHFEDEKVGKILETPHLQKSTFSYLTLRLKGRLGENVVYIRIAPEWKFISG